MLSAHHRFWHIDENTAGVLLRQQLEYHEMTVASWIGALKKQPFVTLRSAPCSSSNWIVSKSYLVDMATCSGVFHEFVISLQSMLAPLSRSNLITSKIRISFYTFVCLSKMPNNAALSTHYHRCRIDVIAVLEQFFERMNSFLPLTFCMKSSNSMESRFRFDMPSRRYPFGITVVFFP